MVLKQPRNLGDVAPGMAGLVSRVSPGKPCVRARVPTTRQRLRRQKRRRTYGTKKAAGILHGVRSTSTPPHVQEFNEWYNKETSTGIAVGAPAFLSAARYEAVKGGPKYPGMPTNWESVVVMQTASVLPARPRTAVGTKKSRHPWIGKEF